MEISASGSAAKTAAPVRKQAPVVTVNALAVLDGGKLLPTSPAWLIDGSRPSRLARRLKDSILRPAYRHGMLRGREWIVRPHRIAS